jgi:hypothetical protein
MTPTTGRPKPRRGPGVSPVVASSDFAFQKRPSPLRQAPDPVSCHGQSSFETPIVGTATLALGILAAMCLVVDVLSGWNVAGVTVGLISLAIAGSRYAVPMTRGRERRIRETE